MQGHQCVLGFSDVDIDPISVENPHCDAAPSPHEKFTKSRARGNISPHLRGKKQAPVLITAFVFIIALNVSAIVLSLVTLTKKGVDRCQTKTREREVVAPLCVPCEQGWMKAGEKEEGGETEGWRRYKEDDVEMCCPLDYHNLASAVHQIYRTVRNEKQEEFRRNPPEPYSSFFSLYEKPTNTSEAVLFANHNKPSAHVTAVRPFDAKKCFIQDPNTSPDNTMQTVCDMPLRFEPYRSTTRGYVQRLTWGLMVPVSGLYRIHSTVNFYFDYPQSTKNMKTLAETGKHITVVHQLTRYHVADGSSTVLAERNETISAGHTDGVTSFLVTLEDLGIGDVISISVSHRSAMALQDRWHSEGLFLVQ